MKFREFLLFSLINNIVNLIGWKLIEHYLHCVTEIEFASAVFLIVFNFLFSIILFLEFKKIYTLAIYVFLILFLPRLFIIFLYQNSNSFYDDVILDFFDSYYGLQIFINEKIFGSCDGQAYSYIDKKIFLFVLITTQTIIVFYSSQLIDNFFKNKSR
jgi:hypothetical protein